jgi:hypothetical protein
MEAMEDGELFYYSLIRIHFGLSDAGVPYQRGFKRVLVSPEERSQEDLERVSIVLERFLDSEYQRLYSEADNDEADGED